MAKLGILITNTGTPDEPTPSAVRRYLREFLSDRRIVHLPRLLWLPILYCLILPFRAKKSAALYQRIWTAQGSPMRCFMLNLAKTISSDTTTVEVGMNYGNPSIQTALDHLKAAEVDEVCILPLFPQYSDTTTASSLDRVKAALRTWSPAPRVRVIHDYHTHPAYIQALADSIQRYWEHVGRGDHLLLSFHGIPKRFADSGDPYPQQCEATASALVTALGLTPGSFTLCYQSKFGYDAWLTPSTQALLLSLPATGIKRLDVVCPGFSVDCLETLEEIAISGKESFIHAGGVSLNVIPCLNDSPEHARALAQIVSHA